MLWFDVDLSENKLDGIDSSHGERVSRLLCDFSGGTALTPVSKIIGTKLRPAVHRRRSSDNLSKILAAW